MGKQQFGVLGLGVMGRNLALNIESKGYTVSVYERYLDVTDDFIKENRDKRIEGTYTLDEFVSSLVKPRKILMMIKAGKPVDDTIDKLKPFLSEGDILIDGGNSFFADTIRREKELQEIGIRFIGAGISGGEDGARNGPAIMPGGQEAAYRLVEPVLTAISAKFEDEPCCTYIGSDGAGHYVKMVHNGIEYGDMQLICEAYFILRNVLGLTAEELHEVFSEWNKGELDSYLIDITKNIFLKFDKDTCKPLVEMIKDTAGQKGTGKWTSRNALDLGVSTPTITEAVYARFISAVKEERIAASRILKGPSSIPFKGDRRELIENVRKALYSSKICSYTQGFSLLRAAAKEYKWNMNYGRIAMIFRGGCIIRARFLNRIVEAFDNNPDIPNLMIDPYFKGVLENYQDAWREVICIAVKFGLAVPALSSALAYFDSYRSEFLPANLLQAQRDYFGAHTYERIDKAGIFHNKWC